MVCCLAHFSLFWPRSMLPHYITRSQNNFPRKFPTLSLLSMNRQVIGHLQGWRLINYQHQHISPPSLCIIAPRSTNVCEWCTYYVQYIPSNITGIFFSSCFGLLISPALKIYTYLAEVFTSTEVIPAKQTQRVWVNQLSPNQNKTQKTQTLYTTLMMMPWHGYDFP